MAATQRAGTTMEGDMSKLNNLENSIRAADQRLVSAVDRSLAPPDQIADHPMPGWRQILQALGDQLAVWRENRLARRALAELDDRSLRDIGLSPECVRFEASRPFWRKLRDLRA